MHIRGIRSRAISLVKYVSILFCLQESSANYYNPLVYFPDVDSTEYIDNRFGWWDSWAYYIHEIKFIDVYGYMCVNQTYGIKWRDREEEWALLVEFSGTLHLYKIASFVIDNTIVQGYIDTRLYLIAADDGWIYTYRNEK